MSTPMSPNAPAGPDDFREQLSAWHDGALPDEASRFVLKRLLHDEGLRAEVGRWQVIGDALRRQPQQRPAADLVARVGAEVDALGHAASVAPAVVRPPARPFAGPALRWVATAAALGLVAVLTWPVDPAPAEPAPVALALTASVPSPSASATQRPLPMPLMRAPVAAATASVPPLVRAPQPTPEQLAPLPTVDAPSRPWPRSGSGPEAYTVDYGVPPSAPPRQ
jgi:hypothetical protein